MSLRRDRFTGRLEGFAERLGDSARLLCCGSCLGGWCALEAFGFGSRHAAAERYFNRDTGAPYNFLNPEFCLFVRAPV